VGFRYTKGKSLFIRNSNNDHNGIFCLFITGLIHKVQRAVYLETDTPEILDEAITVVRKGGSIAIIGD
jgi:hypothetical protein